MNKFYKIGKKTGIKWLNIGKGIVKYFLLLLVTIVFLQYLQTEIYDFAEPRPFAGDYFYNPYQNWEKNNVTKANFHAHSIAWGGLTNGHNTESEIKKAYKKLDYGVAAVSNYHKISDEKPNKFIEIPCYEHGYNISKTHLLAIDAQGTSNLEFSLLEGLNQKQMKINKLLQTASLVALAHPGLRNGYTKDDLRYLKGYNFMEVLSPYFKSFELWDYALAHGNISWLLANDDTHDLAKQAPGRFFNLISIKNKTKEGVLAALKKGNHLGYSSVAGVVDVNLNYIKLEANKLEYRFEGDIVTSHAIVNGHKIAVQNQGELVLNDTTKYIRFEVAGVKSTLYTNPIYKTSKQEIVSQVSSLQSVRISKSKTNNYRLGVLGVWFLLFCLGNIKILSKVIQYIRNQFLPKTTYRYGGGQI